MSSIKVVFEPENRAVEVPRGATVLEAAREASIPLFHPCGGQGICGRCQVKILDACFPQTEREQELFSEMPEADKWHLSCITKLNQDCRVFVPPETTVTLTGDKRSLGQETKFNDPVYTKHYAVVEPPGLDSGPLRSHAEAIAEAFDLTAEKVEYSAISDLAKVFPYYRSRWEVTAVMEEDRIFCLDAEDTRERFFGAAFDIGTTSLVVSLVDLAKGTVLGEMCASNPQAVWGADVIARITHI